MILYNRGLFDSFPNADNVLEAVLFVTTHRGDLEKVNDDIIH